MLEVYSNNVTIAEGGFVPFDDIKVFKGPVASFTGNVINLNRRGVYRISVDATAAMTTAGIAGLQLYKDGVEDTSAQTESSVGANGTAAMGFTTYIQVEDDATPLPGSSPVKLQLATTGGDAVWHVNVCAERII